MGIPGNCVMAVIRVPIQLLVLTCLGSVSSMDLEIQTTAAPSMCTSMLVL